MTLVPSSTFAPILAPAGSAMLLPMKLRSPMAIADILNEVFE